MCEQVSISVHSAANVDADLVLDVVVHAIGHEMEDWDSSETITKMNGEGNEMPDGQVMANYFDLGENLTSARVMGEVVG